MGLWRNDRKYPSVIIRYTHLFCLTDTSINFIGFVIQGLKVCSVLSLSDQGFTRVGLYIIICVYYKGDFKNIYIIL